VTDRPARTKHIPHKMPPLSRSLSRLRSVDFYKKIPSDLTEATLTGAWLSLAASFIMATLLVLVGGGLAGRRLGTGGWGGAG